MLTPNGGSGSRSSFLSGTPAADVSSSVDKLQVGEGVEPLTGDRLSFEMAAPDDLTVYDFTIRVGYTNDDGDFVNVELPVTDSRGNAWESMREGSAQSPIDSDIDAGVSVAVDDCTRACAVSSVTFAGYASRRGVPIRFGPFLLGDSNVWDSAEWQKQAESAGRFEPTDSGADVTLVGVADQGVRMVGSIPVSPGSRTLVAESTSSATLPVITAGDQAGTQQAKLVDGTEVPVTWWPRPRRCRWSASQERCSICRGH